MAEDRRCWCGSDELEPFDERYLSCRQCETLVVAVLAEGDPARVGDDDEDFYGHRYWFEHQRQLGQPDLEARSVADLAERCLHWLDAVLKYRLPPGRALELGCAHGGFVHLLGGAGFDATGLELSPWVVDFARRTFGVTVLLGPLEDQDLEPGSFDVIAAMDVLEHLRDPEGTMRRCVELLADDGVLVVQTPRRPAGKSFEELEAEGDRFVEMLLPDEHLHLFSRGAVGDLCERAGAPHVAFEPALFAHYDMFLVAGRRPLEKHPPAAVDDALTATAASRRTLAMLELYRRAGRRGAAFEQADRDRRERQRQIEELHRLLDADRHDRLRCERLLRQEIERLGGEAEQARSTIEELQAEGAETAAAIAALEEELARSQATVAEMGAAIEKLDADRAQARQAAAELRRERDEVERRRAGLEATVAEQERAAAALAGEIRDLGAAVRRQQDEIADRDRRHDDLAEIHRRAVATVEAQDAAGAELAGEAGRLRRRLAAVEDQVRGLREVVEEHRTSRIYRALVSLGRWRLHDDKVGRALAAGDDAPADGDGELWWSFTAAAERPGGGDVGGETPAIAVDLTALLPGGENGGAKLVATELVRQLSRLAPERRLLLLTSEPCHHELAALDGDNVQRWKVGREPAALAEVLRHQPLSLLLCPMTAPPFADPRVPLICVVHDLQYQVYPELFSAAERAVRDRDFRRAVDLADRVVTVSEYVRGTVLESSGLDPERVVAIHNGLAQRLPEVSAARVDEVLAAHRLERRRFLLYPANFWPHKNHRMLLVAFGRLRHRRPRTELKLVLTGAERPDPGAILAAAAAMGLGDAVVFAGFVADDELTALLHSCLALIFPSLYEGFGIPVVEAMACGRPVLASDVASIPEVAGDAALLFDPRKPEEITAAVERLLDDPDLAAELAARGAERARRIAGVERMARSYLRLIEEVLAAPRRPEDGLFGVHGDGWTAPRFLVGHGAAEAARTLELELISPPGAAAHPPTLTVGSSGGEIYRADLAGRLLLRLRCRLPAAPGWLEVEVEPPFVPAARGVNADGRELGLKLSKCRLTDDRGAVDLLAGGRRAAAAGGDGPGVCVITPSYNQGEFIERTVRSVLGQDVEDLDYLVVDGGSTDATVDVLRRYQDRLRWISEPDDGQADAINKGLAATDAEIIGWLNSDDVYYPGALAAVRRAFADHPEVDVVYGQADHLDEHDAVLEPYCSEPWDAGRLEEVCFLCQPATFFRRRVVERFGPLDPRLQLCMDYEYWLRLSRGGARFAYLERPLAGSRLYDRNKTLGQRLAVHREMNDMLKATLGAVPDRWLSNWAHAVVEDRGMSRDETPLRFAVAVAALSWLAALRWNRSISRQLWRTTWGWIRGNAAARWARRRDG